MSKKVEYRLVEGFCGYRVGSDGSVWSSWRRIKLFGQWGGSRVEVGGKWKRMELRPNRHGYIRVCLRKDGKSYYRSVHSLVLGAFVGHCPDGMEARHVDGDKENNDVSNLCWGTHQDNISDNWDQGSMLFGERIGNSVLTEAKVIEIRALLARGLSHRKIAVMYGVSGPTVSAIAVGRIWKHLA